MARAAPPIFEVSPNVGKERVLKVQPGHSISQLQHSRSESSSMVPNQQHRTDPLIPREMGLLSGHASAKGLKGVVPFEHFRPDMASVPVPTDEGYNSERSQPLPPNKLGPPGVQVTLEEAPSISSARAPSDVRDGPNKLPGKKYPIFSSPPINLLVAARTER